MAFDANQYLEMSTAEPMETKRTPIPEDDYVATIQDVEVFEVRDKPDLLRASVTYALSSPELEEKLGISNPQCRQTIFIELGEHGGFATGENKNIKLGSLREAVGLNDGEFALGMLKGRGPVLVHVTQRSPEGDPDVIYNDVSRVTALND